MKSFVEINSLRMRQISQAERKGKITCCGTQPSRESEHQHENCGKEVDIIHMFRCRYCGFYFCWTCAEKHFGATLQEHKLEFDAFDGTLWN